MKMVQQSKVLQKELSTEILNSKSIDDVETNGIKKQRSTNDDDLINKVTTITNENLSILVPVISDLMALVSKKVTLLIKKLSENY